MKILILIHFSSEILTLLKKWGKTPIQLILVSNFNLIFEGKKPKYKQKPKPKLLDESICANSI